jgi:protein SCO1/2
MNYKIFAVCSFFILASVFLTAYASEQNTAGSGGIGIEEKLGGYIPNDLTFRDENGNEKSLGEIIDKPAIIVPVYLTCPNMCPRLLGGLANVLGKLKLKPGTDYVVLTVSFDPSDTPAIAKEKKVNYIKASGIPFPEDAWQYLTGDDTTINAFLGAVGFTVKKETTGFSHPSAIVVVSPEGKITRYLYGVTFLPFDVTMAINEAAKGKVSSIARKVLLYCFSYDPQGKRYVFNILKVAGTGMIIFIVAFLFYLTSYGKRDKRKQGN